MAVWIVTLMLAVWIVGISFLVAWVIARFNQALDEQDQP